MDRQTDALRIVAQELGILNITDKRMEAIVAAWSRFRDGMDSLKALELSDTVPTFYLAKKDAVHARQH